VDADSEYLHALVGYVSLVYHEARNVRHLIQCGVIEQDPWKLVVALPGNKYKAWRAIQDIRAKAEGSASYKEALIVFERRFRVSLDQIQTLYENPNWRNSACGGNAWAGITSMVKELAVALKEGRSEDVDQILKKLSQAEHNTGLLTAKLTELNAAMQ